MNGIIIIDKPSGWTSHDVVSKLRGLLRERRIGHGGTLDPMATGVLPVFVGRATRAVEFCESAEKEYLAGMRFGLTTDTQDITGRVLTESGSSVTAGELEAVLPRFTGELEQLPPMYSAVKVGGKKLYELARRGMEAERKPRAVTIRTLELTGWDGKDALLRVVCSKGTYVRTLIHDIGEDLGCGAAMSSLRRTRAGSFTLADARTLEEVEAASQSGTADLLLRPVDSLFAALPRLTVTEEGEKRIRNGVAFPYPGKDGTYRVYGPGGFLMLGRLASGVLSTIKSFFEV
ncbi:MAG: tRNA pseudouridine(55) synthase TruB [Oscillospiraceae bacterium]|nr:tRNA pseudouridine(55) synthase TruB [Oscillospiraceae bacterium]